MRGSTDVFTTSQEAANLWTAAEGSIERILSTNPDKAGGLWCFDLGSSLSEIKNGKTPTSGYFKIYIAADQLAEEDFGNAVQEVAPYKKAEINRDMSDHLVCNATDGACYIHAVGAQIKQASAESPAIWEVSVEVYGPESRIVTDNVNGAQDLIRSVDAAS